METLALVTFGVCVAGLVLGPVVAAVLDAFFPAFGIPLRGRGSVYVVQERDDPTAVKVGYTARRTKTRRAEVERGPCDGRDMHQVYAADGLRYAWTVEQAAHRRLRRRRLKRGTSGESYRLPDPDDWGSVVDAIEASARAVRRKARWRLQGWTAWPAARPR